MTISGVFEIIKEPYVTFNKDGIVCFLKPLSGEWPSIMEIYVTFLRKEAEGMSKGDVIYLTGKPYPVKREDKTKLRIEAPMSHSTIRVETRKKESDRPSSFSSEEAISILDALMEDDI